MNAPLPPATTATHLFPGPDARDALPAGLRPEGAREHAELAFEATPDGWRCSVALPELAADALLVPSLVLADQLPGAYAMSLRWGGADEGIDLAPIAVRPGATLTVAKARMERVEIAGAAATGGLDCVETRDALPAPVLVLHGSGPAPTDALLLVSVRQRRIAVQDDGATAPDLDVPAFSQMTRPKEIARHVCSPVSVAMVLAAAGRRLDPEAFARACEHPDHSHLFGMWPLNLARARNEGFGGLVRLFDRVEEIARLLAAGVPVVASIRFDDGALPGAPLARTGGHLVVLRGLAADSVLVNDPAAPSDDAVTRRYDRAPFLEAWLADRGVGYLLWPRSGNGGGSE
ncbi:MAG: C39 family peptidase [Pseudomonadales bacterium]|jgi:hypothetical protein|nr:C39 family peptidase [Pseudomonadales bacterium]